MSIIANIEKKIESVQSEMKWLKQRTEEAESNYVNDEEIDFSLVYSQHEDVERCIEDLVDEVTDLIQALKDLI